MSSAESKDQSLPGPLRQRANAVCRRIRPWFGVKDHGNADQHGLLHWLQELLPPALFIASAVHLLHGLTVPLELPARLVVSNVAAHWLAEHGTGKYPEDDDLALLKIDRQTFQARYGGRSPLDRCMLRDDLTAIIGQLEGLEKLGIDIDLSPTHDPDQDKCADQILALLKSKPKLISTLILPIDLEDRKESGPWRADVAAARVQLADPELDVQFGMARQHRDDRHSCPSLGVALGRHGLSGERQAHCLNVEAEAASGHGDRFNIAFHRLALLRHRPETVLSDQLAALKGKGVKRVILGPGYDRSDEFLTPLGLLNGVDVHAAIALEPHEAHDERLDFVIDVVLGVAFGALVHGIWHAYFDQRMGRAGQPGLAYKWLLLLVMLLAAAILLVLPAASTIVTVAWGWWISPVPMLIGMTVDALVTGSVAAAIEQQAHIAAAAKLIPAQAAPDSVPPLATDPDLVQLIGLHLPAMLWVFCVGWALITLLPGGAH